MTIETSVPSAPQGIFRDVGKVDGANDIPSLENAGTFETVMTSAEAEESASKVERKQKRNIIKRLFSRKKSAKGGDDMKASSVLKLIKHLSTGKRSKGKKVSRANTVASEEASAPCEPEAKTETKEILLEEDAAVTEPVVTDPDALESVPTDTAVLESVPTDTAVLESVTTDAAVSESTAEDADHDSAADKVEAPEMVESETEEEDTIQEIIPEKASFHNESSDYVGMAMVGFLVGLLGSSLYQG